MPEELNHIEPENKKVDVGAKMALVGSGHIGKEAIAKLLLNHESESALIALEKAGVDLNTVDPEMLQKLKEGKIIVITDEQKFLREHKVDPNDIPNIISARHSERPAQALTLNSTPIVNSYEDNGDVKITGETSGTKKKKTREGFNNRKMKKRKKAKNGRAGRKK